MATAAAIANHRAMNRMEPECERLDEARGHTSPIAVAVEGFSWMFTIVLFMIPPELSNSQEHHPSTSG